MSRPVIFLLAIFILTPVMAQTPDSYTYLSRDGLFSFDYPVDWVLSEDMAGQISFASSDDALELGATGAGQMLGTFFTPAFLGRFNGMTLDSTPAEVLALAVTSGGYGDPIPYGESGALKAVSRQETGERTAIAFDTGNGVALVLVDTWQTEMPQYADALQQMIGSVRNASPIALPLVQTFTAPEGALRFSYPAGWIVAESSEPGSYFFASSEQAAGAYVGTSGVVQGTVYPPDFLTRALANEEEVTLLEASIYVPQLFSQGFAFEAAVPLRIGTRSAYVTAGINGVDLESYIYMIETEQGIGLLLAAGPMVELVQYEPTFEAMLATLEFDVPVETAELAVIPADTPLTQEFTLEDESLTFKFPEVWAAAETVSGTAYLANSLRALDRAMVAAPPASGEIQVLLLSSDFLEAQEVDTDAPPLEVAQAVISSIFGELDFNFSAPFEVELGDIKVIQWEAVNAEVETVGYLIPVKDGMVVLFAGAPIGELYAYRDLLPEIVASME